jgi:hypothetical protein
VGGTIICHPSVAPLRNRLSTTDVTIRRVQFVQVSSTVGNPTQTQPSSTVLQPPHHPFSNRLPTATRPLLVSPSSATQYSSADGHPPASWQPQRQFNHHTTAIQPRTNHRKLQPIPNRPSTTTPTIFQSPSNHHPHAPRPRLLPSAATRQDILIPPTPPPSPMPRPCNRNYPTLLAPLSLTNSFRCERRVIAMANNRQT